MGILTSALLEVLPPTHTLFAIDADADMVDYIRQHYPQLGERVWLEDFLQSHLQERLGTGQFAIIGNFPYNISSQILFRAIDYRSQVPELVGMFQKEVAERIVAKPENNKEYGILSVLVQAYFDTEYLFTVKAGSFSPPPKVLSAVVRLSRKTVWKLDCDERLFRRIVKETFGQRRKMLRNTLKAFVPEEALLQRPELLQMRPENLDVAQFVELTQWVQSVISDK